MTTALIDVIGIRVSFMPFNVCADVERPKVERTEITPLAVDEVARLLKAAEGDRFEAMYVLAVTAGMRLGESFGLQSADVDLKGRAVMVQRSLQELNGQLTLTEPKSARGRRRIDIPQMAVDALIRHRARMLAEGLAGVDFVFCNTQGGPMRRSHFHDQHFKRPRRLPTVLSVEEVGELLQCTRNLKQRTFLMTLYAAGLRLAEACALRIPDIVSRRMQLNVAAGKGNKQRLVPLSPRLLEALRQYWKEYRPNDYLFPGVTPDRPYAASCIQKAIKVSARQAGITLSALEFTRRWALQVLPAQFTKTRHFGGWSCRRREAYLDVCQRLLDAHDVPLAADAAEFDPSRWEPFPETHDHCPACGGALQLITLADKPSWRDVMHSSHCPSWYAPRKKLLPPTGFG